MTRRLWIFCTPPCYISKHNFFVYSFKKTASESKCCFFDQQSAWVKHVLEIWSTILKKTGLRQLCCCCIKLLT